MKWKVHLNGEGCYWWVAETPIGPFYVSSDLDKARTVRVEWYPFDLNEPQEIGGAETEDEAKAAAEQYVKDLSRKLKRWLR